jgi:hypothetical protein
VLSQETGFALRSLDFSDELSVVFFVDPARVNYSLKQLGILQLDLEL